MYTQNIKVSGKHFLLNYMVKNDRILDICDMIDLQDLPYRTIEVDMQDFPNITTDEIDLWDLEPILHTTLCVRCVEVQVWEELMLEEEVCDMSLPKLSRAEESVHEDEIKLEAPKINAIEINEKPREMRLVVAIPTRSILGNAISKLHAEQTKILGSKIGRRANPTRSVKRKVHSMCRPPSKASDRQSSVAPKPRPPPKYL